MSICTIFDGNNIEFLFNHLNREMLYRYTHVMLCIVNKSMTSKVIYGLVNRVSHIGLKNNLYVHAKLHTIVSTKLL